jgi:LmbE family N-acetylglucosaminyl deacetylase
VTNPLQSRLFPWPTSRRRLVIVAPHPDDETFGCGLLIARAVRAGVAVAVVVLTDGAASHPNSQAWPPARLAGLRRGETRRALARLGAAATALRFLPWRDGRLDGDGAALALRRVLAGLRAGIVLVTSPADHHPDHRAAYRLTTAAVHGTRTRLATYAVWSRLAGATARRARDPRLGAKRRAALAHRSQVGPYIADDPAGFTFTADLLARAIGEVERFAAVGPMNGSRPRSLAARDEETRR